MSKPVKIAFIVSLILLSVGMAGLLLISDSTILMKSLSLVCVSVICWVTTMKGVSIKLRVISVSLALATLIAMLFLGV